MPVKIPSELQEFLKGKQGWVATSARDGTPNVSIKGSLRLLDDEHLLFCDLFSMKTRKNLQENPKVAIMVYEESSRRGYIFKGSAEMTASGPLYEEAAEALKKAAPQLPAPKFAVRVTVESIYNQSVGPSGGMQIA